MGRALQLVLAAVGAALLVLLIRTTGGAGLADDLHRFGIGFVAVVALELVLDGCHTLGWRQTLDTPSRVGFAHLYWVRQAGTAVNQLTPTASLGGEVVKAMLLRSRVPMTDALASIVAAKVSFALAQTVLVLLGLVSVLARLHDAPGMAVAVLAGFGMTLAGVLGFFLVQRRGMFSTLASLASLLRLRTPLVARLQARAHALDHRLATFHRERPDAFIRSVGWHFAGQLVGLLQLAFILAWLGSPASLGTCLAIEAFALVIDSALFFVPARLGVQEGGRVLIFTALGLSAATGLAVALIVRLDQVAVAALGLTAFGYFSLTSAPGADRSLPQT